MDTLKITRRILTIMLLCLLLSGCGRTETPALQEILQNSEEESELSKGASEDEGEDRENTESGGEKEICVFVCGQVISPGVYYFSQGARKADAVEAAGGFAESANESYVNLAELLTDEMQLYIPAVGEEAGSAGAAATETEAAHEGLINLNTATLEELCTLNGIGESKAGAILSYREEHGGFDSVEELKEVSGIGDDTFEKIKESVYAG